MAASIESVCVVGAGLMGAGIASVCAFHGYQVVVVDLDEKALANGKQRVQFGSDKMAEKRGNQKKLKQGRVEYTTELASAVKRAQLIVECIVENLEAKRQLLQRIEDSCDQRNALIVSNTSSLLIADIGKQLGSRMKARFAGMHFFNPVPKMPLVEIIPSAEMPPKLVQTLVDFAKSIQKVPIICKDIPGFIANRILIPLMAEAIGLVERGVASPDQVDQVCQLGLGLPIGPFRLLDFVGLDTAQNIIKGWAQLYPEEFPTLRQSEVLARLVAEGKKGRKTGHGFYTYKSNL